MAAGLQPVFKHQARDTGEFSGVVRHKDTARSPGDRGDPEVGLADDRTCLFERAAYVNVMFHCRDIRLGIDETGHLRLGIAGFHGGREWPARSMERRVIDGTAGRHPLRRVGGCRVLVRMVGQASQLLRRPV